MNQYNKTGSQIQRRNQWLPGGRRKGRWAKQGQEIKDYNTKYKINKVQGQTVRAKEYSQYFTITRWSIIYKNWNHCAVYLKLIKYYKSTIPKFKNAKKTQLFAFIQTEKRKW